MMKGGGKRKGRDVVAAVDAIRYVQGDDMRDAERDRVRTSADEFNLRALALQRAPML